MTYVLGKMSKGLKKLMKKIVASDAHEQLAVADAKLGSAIKSKMDLDCVYSSNVMELMRCIRSQLPELVSGGDDKVRLCNIKKSTGLGIVLKGGFNYTHL